MAAAYAAVVSVMNVMHNLQLHPHPPISLDSKQAEFLTQLLTFFEEFLKDYGQNLAYSTEADPLESRIADAAHAAEDAIESHIADRYEEGLNSFGGEGGKSRFYEEIEKAIQEMDVIQKDESHVAHRIKVSDASLHEALKKVIQQMEFIQKEAIKIKQTMAVGVQHQLREFIQKKAIKIKQTVGVQHQLWEFIQKKAIRIKQTVGVQHQTLGVQHQLWEFIQKKAIKIKQTVGVQHQTVGVQHQLWQFIQKKANTIKQTVGVQHLLYTKSTPMVGAANLLLQMKVKLLSDWRKLQTIPVVGMGGTGKTTLAIKIYEDRLIQEHFVIRAWATISQEYSIREILVEVLSQLIKNVDEHLSEDALGYKLHKHLFGRRYLIVMDDLWSFGAWDGIRRFLPDNENGSRIVITTRLSNLASNIPNSSSLEMKLLDETSSWELLCKTVFGGKGCPLELEEIGKEIGKSCKGLPLSIVVVGGFLAKSEWTREFWKYIKENLSIIGNLEDYERCLKVLHMSYKQLPIYLKPCFLYMGILPEYDVILVSKLVKLWIAEGFLKPTSGESSLEEIGRGYLKELADRNLVLILKMGITGNIKSCKIHDSLRDLCLREAEKERFCRLTHKRVVNGKCRIVISKNEDIYALSSRSPPVRSLIWDLENEEVPRLNLRLLRILYLRQPCVRPEFLEDVYLEFVNSRFLQLSAFTRFRISILKFWNLQTLIVDGFWDGVDAPTDIWYMPHIRHLLFPNGIYLPDPPQDQDSIVLGNLQTLMKATNFKCSDHVVKRIPNVKKLKASYSRGSLGDGRDYLTNLGHLEKLESLNCTVCPSGSVSLLSLISFPHSLKKLCLEIGQSEYWQQELLDKIGLLPSLQKLTLRYGRFKDGQWETTEGQFRSLKFLHLFSCKNLQVWTIESSHFPCLTNLCLDQLKNLKKIPLEFAEVVTLGVIHVYNCSDSAVVSAKRILEEYEAFQGNRDLQVEVAPESLRTPNFLVHPTSCLLAMALRLN